MNIKYIVIVTDNDGKYDCILNSKIYDSIEDVYTEIINARKKDLSMNWSYNYRMVHVLME
jgi:hypothetical protein